MTTPKCTDCKPFEHERKPHEDLISYFVRENQELKQKIRDLETKIAILKLNKEFGI